MDLISNALTFAMNTHRGQQRNHNKMPYIIHPLDVFNKLREVGISDEHVLAAALLHDVVEDRVIGENLIYDLFGGKVLQYVMECTKTSENYAGKNRAEKWEHYLKCLQVYSKEGQLIKLADRICNLTEFYNDREILGEDNIHFLKQVYIKESIQLYISLIDVPEYGSYFKLMLNLKQIINEILDWTKIKYNINGNDCKRLC